MDFIRAKLRVQPFVIPEERFHAKEEDQKTSTTREPLLLLCTDYVLKMAGVFLNPQHKNIERARVYIYVLFIYPTLITFHLIYFAREKVSFSELIDVLMYMNISTVLCLLSIWIQINRKHFVKCYQNILRDGEYITDEFYRLTGNEIIEKFIPLVIFIALFIIGLGTYPLLIAMFTDAELGTSITLISPQHYPWDSSRISGYLFTFSIQVFISLVAVSVCLSLLLFIFLHWIIFKSHHQIMDRKIAQLDKIAENFIPYVNDRRRAEVYRGLILKKQSDIIKYHQYMLRIIEDFIGAAKGTMNISIVSFYSINIFLVTSFVFIQGTLLNDIKLLNMVTMLAVFFVVQCYVGEYLTKMNDSIKFQLYNTNWFEQSVPYKKQAATFMLLLQRPFHIQFMGSYDINLPLLLDLVQKIYSATQILNKTQARA